MPGYDCRTVPQEGWDGYSNGRLLQLAEAQFDVFITADQNVPYEQALKGRQICIIELSTNNYRRIQAASTLLLDALAKVEVSTLLKVDIP